jgi:hypothetical protein
MYCLKIRKTRKILVFFNNEGGGSMEGFLLDRNGNSMTQAIADSSTTVGVTLFQGKLKKGTYYVRFNFVQSLNPDIAYKLYFQEIRPAKPDDSDGGSSGGSWWGGGGGSGSGGGGGGTCQFPMTEPLMGVDAAIGLRAFDLVEDRETRANGCQFCQ